MVIVELMVRNARSNYRVQIVGEGVVGDKILSIYSRGGGGCVLNRSIGAVV